MYKLGENEHLEPMDPLREDWAQDAISKLEDFIEDRNQSILKEYEDYCSKHINNAIIPRDADRRCMEVRKQLENDPLKKVLVNQMLQIMSFDRPRMLVVKS